MSSPWLKPHVVIPAYSGKQKHGFQVPGFRVDSPSIQNRVQDVRRQDFMDPHAPLRHFTSFAVILHVSLEGRGRWLMSEKSG